MVKEIQYTNIRRVLDNLLDHPMLRDLSLEQVVRYTIRFISLHGFPKFYQDKVEEVKIEKFRGTLPCDLISITQVRDLHTGVCLRAMTDNFTPGMTKHHIHHPQKDLLHNIEPPHPRDGFMEGHYKDMHRPHHLPFVRPADYYLPPAHRYWDEPAFKTQGRIIYTSFPHGHVEVAYKAIPVDEDGFPLLIDNENYLAALEAYIKKQVFTVKFDTGKISAGVLMNAQSEYAWASGCLDAEFTVPSVSEMESITRMMNTSILKMREFDNGFVNLGDREYLRKH